MSRILSMLLSTAASFAADELTSAMPYVQKALSEVPSDILASKPLVAFTETVHNAFVAMDADPAVVPSLTGILGAAVKSIFPSL